MPRSVPAQLARVSFRRATLADLAAIVRVRAAAAIDLTQRYGVGFWSSQPTERGVAAGLRQSYVLLASRGRAVVGTCRLSIRKPWAIEPMYFTPCERAIYLTDMAVRPDYQGRGIGRQVLEEAARIVQAWPANAIRLDAYNADAGAGDFYERTGFTRTGLVEYRGVPLVYYERMV